jgi:hypothetical protein
VPLFVNEHVVGRLIVAGGREQNALVCDVIGRLMDMLEPLEAEIVSLASAQRLAAPTDADPAATPAPAAVTPVAVTPPPSAPPATVG